MYEGLQRIISVTAHCVIVCLLHLAFGYQNPINVVVAVVVVNTVLLHNSPGAKPLNFSERGLVA